MKIKFFNPNNLDRNLKATVHKSGKLGFTVDAANKMDLKPTKSASVGMNEEDSSDTSLYIIVNDKKLEGAFRISKAGNYFYLNLKNLFDTLKINYKSQIIVFDVSEEDFDGQKIYKLTKRENKKSENIEK